jgi:dihydrofolate reductase
VTIIAAVADNGVIGHGNDIPWRLPDDWKRFKQITMGHHLLMGRKTWDSIGRALPGRTTIVISRSSPALPEGVGLADSLAEAIRRAAASGDDEAFVAGGAEIYAQALPMADKLLITRVHCSPEGDTFFPDWPAEQWTLLSEEDHPRDERHAAAFTFQLFERRPPRNAH